MLQKKRAAFPRKPDTTDTYVKHQHLDIQTPKWKQINLFFLDWASIKQQNKMNNYKSEANRKTLSSPFIHNKQQQQRQQEQQSVPKN